ncbi:serine-threonine protein kinase, plant-type, putative [Ricinus communis]|uniref:non-specific serine/threonine protein kinase n=1 Tax=Ricinus communis TaxID=3988 RepID=B9RH25_RICCO|nr:serine-threonine protein kinase, plant-type, putative [Ricinus communis]
MEFHNHRSPLLVYLQLVIFFFINVPWLQANASGNETDRLALLKFKQGISSDPHGIFNSWNDSLHFCKWYGITCGRRHQRVTSLDLKGQNLIGSISPHIGNLSFLRTLDLENNSFHDHIPQEVGKLFRLQYFLLNNNTLQGEVPSNLSRCSQLRIIDLLFNEVEGKIPAELGNLANLEMLLLAAANRLNGSIPDNIGQTLPNLQQFHIGGNEFSGSVPNSFSNASNLVKFSISINRFEGQVPRKSKKSTSSTPLMTDQNIRVSYHDLHLATNGFSSVNLIGSGSFGSVYKGFINQMESPVAIKVLKLQQKGASKSFMAECNALRNVRHRNLVKLLTYCSSLDYKQNEFKALIFEFMENGSLENWLHHNNNDSNSQPKNYLNFIQRLNIAVDVASVLHYLHDLCESPIIHCDLKPSNVLLDEDMIAHVSDFGLARLFLTTAAGDLSQGQSSSTTGIKGTFGYAPPEYAMGSAASKEGDVYSYGILLLEMFSGKRPTDKMFEDGLNLHNFVKNALPKGVEQIMDQSLLPTDIEGTSGDEKEDNSKGNFRQTRANDQLQKGLLSVFEVGIACSRESPKERTNMRDVSKELHLMKSAFVGVRIYG